MLYTLGRSLKQIIFVYIGLSCCFQSVTLAKNLIIFDVRKNLQMTRNEPVYRDYYINGGRSSGIRPGMVISVSRRVSMYDTYSNSSPGDLQVIVGKIKVIHAQETVSVARLASMATREKLPLIDIEAIMVGDQLEMDTAEMDRGSHKEASVEAPKISEPKPIEPTPVEVKPETLPPKVPEVKPQPQVQKANG